MKVLFISPDMSDLNKVRCYTDVWSHFLAREFVEAGIDLQYDPILDLRKFHQHPMELYRHYETMKLDGIDHVFGTGLRYFSTLPHQIGNFLRKHIPGAVMQYNDGQIIDRQERVDMTFTARGLRNMPAGNMCVGWAADPALLPSAQPFDQLVIVVDHPDYTPNSRRDRTADILDDVTNFVRAGEWKRAWGSVRVRRIIDGGFEDVDTSHDGRLDLPFHRGHIPYPQTCAQYSQTHIFLPTHPESVGLTALEMAVCGALVVAPANFIPPDRMETIRNVTYTKFIPWGEVLHKLNIPLNREVASRNSWSAIGEKIIGFMKGFEKGRVAA